MPHPPLHPSVDAAEVEAVRSAARRAVRELGLLEQHYATGQTHSQCHALVELDHGAPLSPARLASILRLDRSSVTRLLAPLIRRGDVEVEVDPHDQRGKRLSLTDAGRERVAAVNRRANEQVLGALALLDPDERATVRAGLDLYARALERSRRRRELEVRPIRRRDDPHLARIVREVMTEHGAVGCGYSIEDAELDGMSATYRTPGSAYFVAVCDGRVLGGGGIGPLTGGPEDVCELRKMYLLPEARGLGAGRALLERCLETARTLGYARCYLETIENMQRARALYERAGFQPLDAPMGDTGHHKCESWMLLELPRL